MAEERLGFSSYHLKFDPEKHAAAYGARLLWDEVARGGAGVVGDRQSGVGDHEVLKAQIFPVVDHWTALVREQIKAHRLSSSSEETVELREGRVLVVGSPQGSYGYLYVTAVLERERP